MPMRVPGSFCHAFWCLALWHILHSAGAFGGVHITLFELLHQVAKMSFSAIVLQRDVPGFTRAAVPILYAEGVRAVTVGVNGGSAPPGVPHNQPFIWRDTQSQAELLAMWHPGNNHLPIVTVIIADFVDVISNIVGFNITVVIPPIISFIILVIIVLILSANSITVIITVKGAVYVESGLS